MASELAQAKTLILKWFDKEGLQPKTRQRLSAGIDCFFSEIANREHWSECLTTLVGDASAPHILASGEIWRATSCQSGLAVSSVVPGWGFGWRKVLQDEDVYQILSLLGYYARQYLHRSQIAKILMVVWERDGVILHPFGSKTSATRYGHFLPPITPRAALNAATKQIEQQWGEIHPLPMRSASAWTRRNTLDPSIHQGIFHFLRGQNLLQAGFELEALIAFDCVIQSLQTMKWPAASGNPRHSRTDLCNAMGFKEPTAKLAEHIYLLRNNFGAHAGGWRWWDYEENIDDEFLIKATRFTLRALRRAADLESDMRTIDPLPANWSKWLLSNFPAVWNTIWYRT